MPQALTMIQINKVTPVPSVLVITLMSLVYLSSSNIIQLMNYVGFATWLAIGVAVFCVIYLRFKHPEWERPIKVILAGVFYNVKNGSSFITSKSSSKNLSNENKHCCFCCLQNKSWIEMPKWTGITECLFSLLRFSGGLSDVIIDNPSLLL